MFGGEVWRERRSSGGVAGGGALDCYILQRAVKLRKRLRREIQDLRGQVSRRGAWFYEQKFRGTAQLHPHFLKLASEKAAEDGAGIHAGEIIATRRLLGARVIAVLRIVEACAHIFREGDGASGANVLCEDRRQWRGIIWHGARAAYGHQFTRCGLRVNISMM